VYGRFGKPCLRCSTPIEVRKHGEQARVTYWCPTCQLYLPLPEPDPNEVRDQDGSRGRRFPWRRKAKRDDGTAPGDDLGDARSGPSDDQHGDRGPEPQPAAVAYLSRRRQPLALSRLDPLLAPDA
jgi:hypothetical protein